MRKMMMLVIEETFTTLFMPTIGWFSVTQISYSLQMYLFFCLFDQFKKQAMIHTRAWNVGQLDRKGLVGYNIMLSCSYYAFVC